MEAQTMDKKPWLAIFVWAALGAVFGGFGLWLARLQLIWGGSLLSGAVWLTQIFLVAIAALIFALRLIARS
ncbi:hypothetical protein ACSBLW_15755 [Thioclava sp. FR2]|uniref:hypothetical protein n=1 Tax=Thioclava sp. FR2 TaxID=3445780 RepID=UPI003EBAD253